VPGFEPSRGAFAPSQALVELQQRAIADAVAAGELGSAALEEAGLLVSILIKGVLTQAMTNEPHVEWGHGRFTPIFPRLMGLLPAAYPPAERPRPARKAGRARQEPPP
jgi:hypothetical protein